MAILGRLRLAGVWSRRLALGIGLAGPPLGAALAQSADDGAQSLQEAAQNPIASLISVPFQGNIYTGVGPDDDALYVLNIQPVVPISFNERWNLIVRPILPIVHTPQLGPGFGDDTGLGNLLVETFVSPSQPVPSSIGEIVWGVGGVLGLPTHTAPSLGTRNYTAGPAFVTFINKAPFTYGFLLFNQWSFAGPSSAPDTNAMTLQPFLNYNLANGWSVGTAPIITANWEASDDKWTVPIGGGVTKLMTVGKQPINIQLRGYYNVVRPDEGPEFQSQLALTFLFPK